MTASAERRRIGMGNALSNGDLAVWTRSEKVDDSLSMTFEIGQIAFAQAKPRIVNISVPDYAPIPVWVESVARQANDLVGLKSGWDTYGGRPIEVPIMVTALKILGDIMPVFGPAPELTPRSSGGLDIEWEGDFGELSITVAPTGQPTAYYSSPTGDEWESLLDERLGDVRAILEANRIAPPTIG